MAARESDQPVQQRERASPAPGRLQIHGQRSSDSPGDRFILRAPNPNDGCGEGSVEIAGQASAVRSESPGA